MDPRLETAVAAVTDSARVARAVQADLEAVREITKDDRSPVTVADFAVQAIVALRLRQALGEVLIVGEEAAGELRRDEHAAVRHAVVEAVRRVEPGASETDVLDAIDACDHDASAGGYWTLDPVDGTKGFLRGQQYAVSLAWLEDGEVRLGALGCPNLSANLDAPIDKPDATGTVYAAALGGGAWERAGTNAPGDSRRLTPATSPPGSARTVRVCESVEKAHSKQSDTQRIMEALGVTAEPVRLDSQCKYAVVARGQADAYLRLPTRAGYIEKIWDHAAGMLVATEAGAIVTDIAGNPLDFTHGELLEGNRGIVCAAASLHARIIEAIDALGIGGLNAETPKRRNAEIGRG